jgi:hypothetical protein
VKTRVVRYWYETQWLYKVEKYIQADGKEQWMEFGGIRHVVLDAPKAGEWYWAFVAAPLSAEHAAEVAKDLATAKTPDLTDVVAEYDGEAVSNAAMVAACGSLL